MAEGRRSGPWDTLLSLSLGLSGRPEGVNSGFPSAWPRKAGTCKRAAMMDTDAPATIYAPHRAQKSDPRQTRAMGVITDVLCLPCRLLSAVLDFAIVIVCCPCRTCCGCPSTSTEAAATVNTV